MLYTVQKGDTLGKIAAKFLGDSTRFKEILAVNPDITNPDIIRIGQTITIQAAPPPTVLTAPIPTSRALVPTSTNTSSFMTKVKDFYSNKKVMLVLALGLAGVLFMIKMNQRKLTKV
jgi:LysM repeat protein